MSSLLIIFGAAARMKRLIHEPNDSVELLLQEMLSVVELLNDADLVHRKSKQFLHLEKLLVQLSYDIADVVELTILSKSTPTPIKGSKNLESVTIRIKCLKCLLDYIIKNRPYSRSQRREMDIDGVNVWRDDNEGVGAVEGEVKEGVMASEVSVPAVCIYGDRGSGKTNLAKKVLADARAGEYFEGFAWIRVGRECQPRKVFEEMLQWLDPTKNRADISGMDKFDMLLQILAIQREKRCLIVVDGIRAVDYWKNIRSALQVDSTSRTLITTSSIQVADMVRSKARLCEMKPLNGEEIFSLLKKKASFSDHELRDYGKSISSLSQGSPLLAVALGKSFKAANEQTRKELVDELDTYRNRMLEGENQVFDICYDILNNGLKLSWIYMSLFPEGHDIQVEKLHLLLEAEGMIYHGTSWNYQKFLQSFRDILQELSQRNLVKLQEDEASLTTMYKSCRLHPLVRSFCISKARENRLFEIAEVKIKNRKKGVVTIPPYTRRLAMNLRDFKGFQSITMTPQKTVKKIRSILIFDTLGSATPSETNGLKQLSSLRVLDFNGIDFKVGREVLKGIHNLVLLRYLGFQGCWLEALRPSVSKLQMLETLDLRVRSNCCMIIPNDVVSNMKRLRNLYFPLLYQTQEKTKLRLCGLEKLEILVHFHAQVCDVNDLSQLASLQILTAISDRDHEDLAAIVEISDSSNLQQTSFIVRNFNFNCSSPERAAVLMKLLECRSLQSLRIQGRMNGFPGGAAIAPNLSEVVFDGCEIEDDPTHVLLGLSNLRSVVMANDAFVGEKMSVVFSWECCPNLRSLKILNLGSLRVLAFHVGSVPKLSSLVVENCVVLDRIWMSKAMDDGLQALRRKKGDDVYSVSLNPTIIRASDHLFQFVSHLYHH